MASALEYAHSLIFTIFYVLPVDEEQNKFVPGLERLFASCVRDSRRVKNGLHCVGSFLKLYIKVRASCFAVPWRVFCRSLDLPSPSPSPSHIPFHIPIPRPRAPYTARHAPRAAPRSWK